MVQPVDPPLSLRLPAHLRVMFDEFVASSGLKRGAAGVRLIELGLDVEAGEVRPSGTRVDAIGVGGSGKIEVAGLGAKGVLRAAEAAVGVEGVRLVPSGSGQGTQPGGRAAETQMRNASFTPNGASMSEAMKTADVPLGPVRRAFGSMLKGGKKGR